MDASTFNNTLAAFRGRVSFRSFTVTLGNGDRFEVDHREAFVVRDGVAVYLGPGGVPILFDHEGVTQVAST